MTRIHATQNRNPGSLVLSVINTNVYHSEISTHIPLPNCALSRDNTFVLATFDIFCAQDYSNASPANRFKKEQAGNGYREPRSVRMQDGCLPTFAAGQGEVVTADHCG